MPKGNGTGPRGEGPMTGKGMGFCVLKRDEESPNLIEGFIGIEGKTYRETIQNRKKVTTISSGDIKPSDGQGPGPVWREPITGRVASYFTGYPVPGFMNMNFGWRAMGYGRTFFYRQIAHPSETYTSITTPSSVYLRVERGRGRGRGRGWRRGRGFRYW